MEKTSKKSSADRYDPSKDMAEGEAAVMEKINAMPEPYKSMGLRLHDIVKENAPNLKPRVWYGMPGYAKDGKVVFFFRGVFFQKKERYMTLGFNDNANLDEGNLWPISYALIELTPAEEEKIAALIRKAVS